MIIFIDQKPLTVDAGLTVAAALALSGSDLTRTSCTGLPRAPFCGMGICHECRVSINGRRELACQTLCHDQMHVERLT